MRKSAHRKPSLTRRARGPFSGRLSSLATTGRHKSFRVDPAFFGLVIDSLAEYAVLTMDRDLTISSWNTAAEKIFGYTQGEVIGTSVAPLFTAEDRRQGYPSREFNEALAKGRVEDERYHIAKGGRRLWSYGLSFPLRDEAGVVRGYVKIIRDESKRKLKDEVKTVELAAKLERLVKERTASLLLANEELESFAYSASHDLRGPLRKIKLYSQAILENTDNVLDERSREYFKRIQASAADMDRLIDATINFTHATAKGMSFEEVDLSRLAAEIAEDLCNSDRKRNVRFDIEPDLHVQGDLELLSLALQNLLDNAWKFTYPRPQARIEFGRSRQDTADVYFVRDNGVGFDMKHADKLFRPFERLHEAREFSGTGVGLGIVERVIRKHRGRVWARNAPGQGATFFFSLFTEAL